MVKGYILRKKNNVPTARIERLNIFSHIIPSSIIENNSTFTLNEMYLFMTLWTAFVFGMGTFASIFAFNLGGIVLSYHTDFYKIDVDDLGYGDSDPRWIGAWWLGMFIYGGIFLVISIPHFFFPKVRK